MAAALFWNILLLNGSFFFQFSKVISTCLLLLCCAGIWLFGDAAGREEKLKFSTRPRLGVMALLGTVIVVQLSSSYVNAQVDAQLLQKILSVTIFIGSLTRLSLSTLIRSFVYSASLQVLAGLILIGFGLQARLIPSGYRVNPLKYRFSGLLFHPNQLGLVAAAGLIVAINWRMRRTLQIFLGLGLALSEYRGGLLAAATVVICRLWLSIPKREFRVLSAAPILFLTYSLVKVISAAREQSGGDALTGRREIWKFCFDAAQTAGALGHGPLYVARSLGESSTTSLRVWHCHNQLLDDWVNYGMAGLAVDVLVILVILFVLWRRKSSNYLLSFLALMLIAQFEVPFRLFTGNISYAFIVVLVVALAFCQDPQDLKTVHGGITHRAVLRKSVRIPESDMPRIA